MIKVRELNIEFIKHLMSILAAPLPKNRKIVKKVRKLTKIKTSKLKRFISKEEVATPKTSCEVQGNEERSSYRRESNKMNYFQSYNPYILGSINSISFCNCLLM